MATRTTDKELTSLMQIVNTRTGLDFAFHTHNGRGYGLLYLKSPNSGGISNQIAGNMWEGVTKREAACILRAIDNLVDFGADFSAVMDRAK